MSLFKRAGLSLAVLVGCIALWSQAQERPPTAPGQTTVNYHILNPVYDPDTKTYFYGASEAFTNICCVVRFEVSLRNVPDDMNKPGAAIKDLGTVILIEANDPFNAKPPLPAKTMLGIMRIPAAPQDGTYFGGIGKVPEPAKGTKHQMRIRAMDVQGNVIWNALPPNVKQADGQVEWINCPMP
jgi:hypothetical protein